MGRNRDKLFLLAPGFEDPAHPGQRFVCPHSNQIEGVLASFPELAGNLDIERVPFARPRQAVIAVLGRPTSPCRPWSCGTARCPTMPSVMARSLSPSRRTAFSTCWPSAMAFRACMADGDRYLPNGSFRRRLQ